MSSGLCDQCSLECDTWNEYVGGDVLGEIWTSLYNVHIKCVNNTLDKILNDEKMIRAIDSDTDIAYLFGRCCGDQGICIYRVNENNFDHMINICKLLKFKLNNIEIMSDLYDIYSMFPDTISFSKKIKYIIKFVDEISPKFTSDYHKHNRIYHKIYLQLYLNYSGSYPMQQTILSQPKFQYFESIYLCKICIHLPNDIWHTIIEFILPDI